MSNLKIHAIVLRRTNIGEADRLIDFVTESGQVTALARSARRARSKLAGGIEPFTLSEISVYHSEKSHRNTLTSVKMLRFYKNILADFDSLSLASSLTKQVARALRQIDQDNHSPASSPVNSPAPSPSSSPAPLTFFSLLNQSYAALDDRHSIALVETWAHLNLHVLKGNQVNFLYDASGAKLSPDLTYSWDLTAEALTPSPHGPISASHIKLARLMLASPLALISRVKNVDDLLPPLLEIAKALN